MFLQYLESCSVASLDRLYTDTNTSVTVYRLLPELAQYMIRRLLLVEGPTPFESLRAFHRPATRHLQNPVILRLKHLQILQGRKGEVWLNEEFRHSLLRAFSGDLENPPMQPVVGTDDHWESLLYMLVTGSRPERLKLTHFMDVLVGAGLASETGGAITNRGFQFLLEDRTTQLWTLLVQYFSMAEAAGLDTFPMVTMVCRVAIVPVGSILEATMVSDFLVELGLVLPGRSNQVTLLAGELLSPLNGNTSMMVGTGRSVDGGLPNSVPHSAKHSNGYIVIETNYKVYAYTTSPLQIAILGLFVRLRDRFTNMVHGQLTGPSVAAALSKGITAAQLIAYLRSHLHPVMRDEQLPAVIEDQVHLWERDRERIRSGDGYLYQQFVDGTAFSKTVEEATRLSAVLYVNYQRRLLIVKPEAHSSLKAFIKAER
ncbi:hypothetical protein PSACC_01871 [Paramicrosporidium saccamoebae]|uniref:RNA polymerase II transcription factor B subunit 2 n=1 Tax=Paramicrosporidium saccamoebae TaxID=1246581 RepID=A0A2H9TKQ3_9FUNG|nr:hypothetical protein PSACC_01871 [Paramicrosporidium saccamoebae]